MDRHYDFKEYEEACEELISATFNVSETELFKRDANGKRIGKIAGNALAHAAMSVQESIKTFLTLVSDRQSL